MTVFPRPSARGSRDGRVAPAITGRFLSSRYLRLPLVRTFASLVPCASMDGPQVSWVLLGGISFPAVLTEQKDGKFIATSPDWRIAVHGDSASGALSALSRELDRLIEEAITRRRREDKAGSM